MKYLLYSLVALILFSCAQIQNPDGGPTDEIPPKIKKAYPNIGATNFNDNEVKVIFDEFIVLNQINQEAIVSPPMSTDPEYKVNNKTLKVSLGEALLPNTTYTINLGNGIKDFHEGVVLDSNVLVFSTGDYIDSLSISGTVKNALDLKPQEKFLVLMYESDRDSIPSKKRPYYYTKTDEFGNFKLNYLKSGPFSLFVLEDKNSNRFYDLPNEQIGFLMEQVNTSNADSLYTIHSFQPDNEKQFVVSLKEEKPGKLILILNKPAEAVDVKILGRTFKKPWYESDTILQGDTVRLWTDLARLEEQEVGIVVTADNAILDTVKLKLSEFDSSKIQTPTLSTNIKSGFAKYFDPLYIYSDIPIKSFNDSILLTIGTEDTIKVGVSKVGSKKLQVNYNLQQESSHTLILPDSFATDILGFKSKELVGQFKTKSDIEYANLKLGIELTSSEHVILQFLNKAGTILREVKFVGNQSFEFINLSPGEYQLKMIFDSNIDGKWTTGKYIPRTLPERVIFYSEKLEMKEGWDKDITWTIPE